MLEEKPETLVATFLVDQREEVRMAQDRVADLVIRKGNLLKLHNTCNNDLLARVCSQAEGRQVILKLTSRASQRSLAIKCREMASSIEVIELGL